MKRVVHLQNCPTPWGKLLLGALGDELCLCLWESAPSAGRVRQRIIQSLDAEFLLEASQATLRAAAELEEYFSGKRKGFDIPLILSGTPFQKSVWEELTRIPRGRTLSYRELAGRIGKPGAVRAAANAVGANGICIFVPCHRVIASGGALGGYAGGAKAKKGLLELEHAAGLKLQGILL